MNETFNERYNYIFSWSVLGLLDAVTQKVFERVEDALPYFY